MSNAGLFIILSPALFIALSERMKRMKINIYENKRVIKTYTADAYDLEFGILEDVADTIKLDDMKTGSDTELLKMIANAVINSKETVKYLLKDIFDGITDDEIKHTRVSEIAAVLLDVVKFTIAQLNKGLTEKN